MATALILIDIQAGFDSAFWGMRNNPDAESHAARLLVHWRKHGLPLFHIRHISQDSGSPLAEGKPGTAFKAQVMPLSGEPIIEKTVNSAFIGTDLEPRLHEKNVQSVVICGLTTPHCVSTTTRMAANLGFRVTLAHEACAAFSSNADMSWNVTAPSMTPEEIHATAIAHLHGEFAEARNTDSILANPA